MRYQTLSFRFVSSFTIAAFVILACCISPHESTAKSVHDDPVYRCVSKAFDDYSKCIERENESLEGCLDSAGGDEDLVDLCEGLYEGNIENCELIRQHDLAACPTPTSTPRRFP